MNWNLMDNAISFCDRLKIAKFVLSSNRFTNGIKVKELEQKWNEWLGCEHSLFVSSGSTANFLLIASIKEMYKLKPGDKVLVPACTWMTNVAPIIQLGLTPIFCDVQIDDFSFDVSELEYISKEHPDIKLIFVTHLLGFSSQSRIDGLLETLFPKALIVDDVCESHGCKNFDGSKVGSNSLGATFSTYFGHHLTSIEGGFVSTNNEDLYDLMKMKRSHGMARESVNFDFYAKRYPNIDKSFLFITDGYNFRNTEINAVLGLSQLNRLDKSIKIRNENFKEFCDLLKQYSFLHPTKYSELSSNFCLPIIAKNKKVKASLETAFKEENIEYRPIVSGNLLKHPFLKGYSLTSSKAKPFVETLHNNGLYIGNSQFVNKDNLAKLKIVFDAI